MTFGLQVLLKILTSPHPLLRAIHSWWLLEQG